MEAGQDEFFAVRVSSGRSDFLGEHLVHESGHFEDPSGAVDIVGDGEGVGIGDGCALVEGVSLAQGRDSHLSCLQDDHADGFAFSELFFDLPPNNILNCVEFERYYLPVLRFDLEEGFAEGWEVSDGFDEFLGCDHVLLRKG